LVVGGAVVGGAVVGGVVVGGVVVVGAVVGGVVVGGVVVVGGAVVGGVAGGRRGAGGRSGTVVDGVRTVVLRRSEWDEDGRASGRARRPGRSGAGALVVPVVVGAGGGEVLEVVDVLGVLEVVVVLAAGRRRVMRAGGPDSVGVSGGGIMAVEPPASLGSRSSCWAAGATSSVALSPPQAASRPGTAMARHAITGRRDTVHLQDQVQRRTTRCTFGATRLRR
jgi:hypothetical protein